MMGIASYFAVDFALPVIAYFTLFIFVLCLPIAVPAFRRPSYVALLLLLFGHAYAFIRADLVDTRFIERKTFFSGTAVIEDIDERPSGFPRIIFSELKQENQDAYAPEKVQLNVRTKIENGILPGDVVSLSAVLEPPSGKVSLTGYDFRRAAYFKGIEATGFSTTPIVSVNDTVDETSTVNRTRLEIATYLSERMEGDAGKLAAALLVGKRGALSRDVVEDMRASGLAHMLAISGLHMGLFVAAAFFALESVLLLTPPISRQYDCRKIAAIGALITATGYLALSGFGVATLRAYIITAIALCAILLDRRVVSLRSLAIAAIFMLLLSPDAILGAGFQMSFAATAALVVFYENLRKRRQKKYEEQGDSIPVTGVQRMAYKVANFFIFTCITTIVAQMAVAPFSLIHFQSVSLYGLLANIIAVPALLFVVVPAAFASAISAIFGLDFLFLPILEWGLNQIIAVAEYVADLEGGTFLTPPPLPYVAITCLVIGVSCLVLQGSRYISIALVGAYIAVPIFLINPEPDIIIAQNSRAVAYSVRDRDKVTTVSMRQGGFLYKNMLQQWGADEKDMVQDKWKCDSEACSLAKVNISHVLSMSALRRECTISDIVILQARWRRYCRGEVLILSEEALSRYGPAYIYDTRNSSSDGLKVKWANPQMRTKPWK
jgi:competence protein ComEC